MKQIQCLLLILLVVVLLGTAHCFRPPLPTLIENSTMLVGIEGEKVIIQIQTSSKPEYYTVRSIVFGDSNGNFLSDLVVFYPCCRNIKHSISNGMFVIETDKHEVTRSLKSINMVSVILHNMDKRVKRHEEEYLYQSDKYIYSVEKHAPPPP